MFEKILIANRGEIACRIARTARLMGITTVAVYSEADRFALHLAACDEAFGIDPAEASESYLNAQKILDIAKRSGAEAIHPGYGFLSENADFALACEQSGVVFIGPTVAAIKAMGSKSEAKNLMQKAGVPLVPGYHGEEQNEQLLAQESKRIGFPQLIKASAGGGGKGMRVVNQASEFKAALASAKRESLAAFGSDKVLIERYLLQPRHVEIQIFADKHGNVVHLYERDCSIQRRHQKILEEAPAPGMTEELRSKMTKAAINCAKAIDYVGAGTVEFLLDQDGSFYFMEMNTRLQVEHPVTEMITGLDLVQWQFEVAAGSALPLRQEEVTFKGHAIEARIYAESPENEFLPATGKLLFYQTPAAGSAVRIDTGVGEGDEIGLFYDPMIAKLITHAPDRKLALIKMRQALNDYQIMGLQTNIGFLASLVSQQQFINAEFDTGFIEKHREQLISTSNTLHDTIILLAGLYRLVSLSSKSKNLSPWQINDGWRMNQPVKHRLTFYDLENEYQIEASARGTQWIFKLNQKQYKVNARLKDKSQLLAEIDNQKFDVPVIERNGDILVWHANRQWQIFRQNPAQIWPASESKINQLIASMPGSVIALLVKPGDKVSAGDVLVVIEAMKMEHSIVASADAEVKDIFFQPGDQVEEGDRLISLE